MRDISISARRLIALVITLGCVSAGRATVETDMAAAKIRLEADLQRIIKIIDAKGTPAAQLALASVTVIVEDSPLAAARVGIVPGKPGITLLIPNSYRLLLTYFAEQSIINARRPHLLPCGMAYQTYVFEAMSRNRTRMFEKLPLEPIDAPEIYAQTGSACKDLVSEFPLPTNEIPQREKQVFNALVFTLFHELGHMARSHTPISDERFAQAKTDKERETIFLAEMRRSRDQEYAADRWAARQLMKMNAHPLEIVNVPLVEMLLASSGLDTTLESIGSHPLALNRLEQIILEIENSNREIYKRDLPQEIAVLFSDLQSLAKKTIVMFNSIQTEVESTKEK